MLNRRVLFVVVAVTVLGVLMGLVIAEVLGGGGPAPVVWAGTPPATATRAPTEPAAEPTSPPTATAAPTSPPTATRAPTSRPTASAPTSPPTATAAPETATPEDAFIEYTVQSGDVLATIARRFGVTVEDILAVNTIANPRSLVVGEVIRIPASSSATDYIEYAVQPGDILFTIARRFGVTVEDILAINEIANPDGLVVGQVIRIPLR